MKEKDNKNFSLYLKCDVKCGFKDLYLVERGMFVRLDFLQDLYNTAESLNSDKETSKQVFGMQEFLYLNYQSDPKRLLKDSKALQAVKDDIAETFKYSYFLGIDFDAPQNRSYPEICQLSNLSLELLPDDDLVTDEEYFEADEDDPNEGVLYDTIDGERYYKC